MRSGSVVRGDACHVKNIGKFYMGITWHSFMWEGTTERSWRAASKRIRAHRLWKLVRPFGTLSWFLCFFAPHLQVPEMATDGIACSLLRWTARSQSGGNIKSSCRRQGFLMCQFQLAIEAWIDMNWPHQLWVCLMVKFIEFALEIRAQTVHFHGPFRFAFLTGRVSCMLQWLVDL